MTRPISNFQLITGLRAVSAAVLLGGGLIVSGCAAPAPTETTQTTQTTTTRQVVPTAPVSSTTTTRVQQYTP
jgi:hypothetical protein